MDENKNPAITSKNALKLGIFGGSKGKENCRDVCRKFALTGCEWDFPTGDCYAHMKSISIGTKSKSSLCFKFQINPGKKAQVTF